MSVTTLEECGIVAGSFGCKPDICDGGRLIATGSRGNPIVVADFEDEEDCRLVAHRCNLFDRLVAVLESIVADGQKGFSKKSIEFNLGAAKAALLAAKGTTP